MDSGIALQNFQKLWGTGTEQSLTTTLGAVNIPTFSASLPSITSTGDGVILSDYNVVSGIKVTDTANGSGIVGSNITRANIAHCVISNTGENNVS
jgi:hypothetical protein